MLVRSFARSFARPLSWSGAIAPLGPSEEEEVAAISRAIYTTAIALVTDVVRSADEAVQAAPRFSQRFGQKEDERTASFLLLDPFILVVAGCDDIVQVLLALRAFIGETSAKNRLRHLFAMIKHADGVSIILVERYP